MYPHRHAETDGVALLYDNYGLVMAILVLGVSFEHSAWLVSTTLLNDYAPYSGENRQFPTTAPDRGAG